MDEKASYLSFVDAFYEAELRDSRLLAWRFGNDEAIRTWQRT